MPGWHKALEQARRDQRVVLLGVIQEQHPARCRLFAQWHSFDWPILHDPVNRLGLRAVPVAVAIDEHGIVRDRRPDRRTIDAFLNTDFRAPATAPPVRRRTPLAALREQAQTADSAGAWRALGDALVLWEKPAELDEAVGAFQRAAKYEAADGRNWFRLGVALRRRYESGHRREDDFQAAVRAWEHALERDPNHYIYRRRIQQYGPRLDKPYPFYDWVAEARRAIRARGQEPVALAVEPSGAEIAHPSRRFEPADQTARAPDPDGRITRDTETLIAARAVVVPGTVRVGETARIHLEFEPRGKAHWNNEVEPLRMWVETPDGWRVDRSLWETKLPRQAESEERRSFEFEVQATAAARATTLRAYALYYVCEEEGGTCLYLRQDLRVPLQLAP